MLIWRTGIKEVSGLLVLVCTLGCGEDSQTDAEGAASLTTPSETAADSAEANSQSGDVAFPPQG